MHVVRSAAAAMVTAVVMVSPAAVAAGGAGFSPPDHGRADRLRPGYGESAGASAAAEVRPSRYTPQQQQQQEDPPAQPPVSIAGKWTVSLDMAMGTAEVALEFSQDGEKIKGTYAGRYGAFPLEGTVKGRAVEFVVTTTIEGQQSSLWFGGEVAEDGQTIKGPAELGGAGEAYWTAKRAKQATKPGFVLRIR